MALGRWKTEHNGPKNGDKIGKRIEVKTASKKRRRRDDKSTLREGRNDTN